MKRYKVVAGACVCGPQQTILNFGDEKDADFFQPGQAEELVERKFLVEVEPAEEAEETVEVEETKKKKKKATDPLSHFWDNP